MENGLDAEMIQYTERRVRMRFKIRGTIVDI